MLIGTSTTSTVLGRQVAPLGGLVGTATTSAASSHNNNNNNNNLLLLEDVELVTSPTTLFGTAATAAEEDEQQDLKLGLSSPSSSESLITMVSSMDDDVSTNNLVKPTPKIMESRIYFHQNSQLLFLNFEDFYLETQEDVDVVIKFIELTFTNYLADEELQRKIQTNNSLNRRSSFIKEKPNNSKKKTNIDVYICYDRFHCQLDLLKYYSEKVAYLEANYYRSVKRFTTESLEDKLLKKFESVLEQQEHVDEPIIQNFEMLNGRYIIQSEHLIARGTFGRVFLGQDKLTGDLVAVKELKRRNINNVEGLKELIDKELKICKLLSTSLKDDDEPHIGKKYICKIYDVIDTESFHYIVMEYLANGSLENPLEERETFPPEIAKKYIKQLAYALDYIHTSLKICHRDIQLANLCLDANGNIKLVDFGLSDFFTKEATTHNSFCGNYASPEMILATKYIGYEGDCYGMGMLLYKLLSGFFPFRSSVDKIVEQYYIPLDELEREGTLDELSISLIKGLLEKDASKRFTTQDVINHEWLQDVEV